MRTNKKISILLVSVLSIFLIVFFVYHHIRSRELMIFKKSLRQSDEQVITNVLEFKSQGFLKPVQDNSAWDGMADLTKTKDTVWGKENLDAVRITFDMSYLGAYDQSGNLIFAAKDSLSRDFSLSRLQVLDYFERNKILQCFMKYNDRLYEIFGAPIVPTYDINYLTPPLGYLIAVKQWDSAYISEIEKTTGFKLDFFSDLQSSIEKSELNEENIVRPVTDYKAQTMLFMRFSRSNVFSLEMDKLKFIKYFTVLTVILSAFVFFIMTSKWFSKPLKMITKSLIDDDLKPIGPLLEQKGEFGDIARLIKEYQIQKNFLFMENKARKEATEKYKALLMAQPDMMFILDRSGNFLDYYTADEKLLFTSPDKFLGKNMDQIFSPELTQKIKQTLHELEYGNPVQPLEYELAFSNQHNYFEARLMAMDHKRILAIVRDITERKETEEKLITALEKAKEADRMKSAFLNNMSHEIRTPMNAIIGFSELMTEAEGEEKQQYAAIVKKSSKQLLQLIEDVILMSRLQSETIPLNKKNFSPACLIRELHQAYSVQEEKNELELKMDLPVENQEMIIRADEEKIQKIFHILISNALKFTLKGSVEWGYRTDHNFIEFFIQDTGIGIPEQEQPLVFDNFYRGEQVLSAAIGGTGLGLNIAKALVELMGGEIFFSSQPNQGSRFSFRFPIEKQAEGSSEKKPGVIAALKGSEAYVLIAEDEPDNYFYLEILLKNKVEHIDHAINGKEAVEMVSKKTYHLILMDLKMPIMGGLEATEKIKSAHPGIPVIAVTAYAQPEEKESAIKAGCDDYVTKPIEKRKLFSIMGRYFESFK